MKKIRDIPAAIAKILGISVEEVEGYMLNPSNPYYLACYQDMNIEISDANFDLMMEEVVGILKAASPKAIKEAVDILDELHQKQIQKN